MFWWHNHFDHSTLSSDSIYMIIKPIYQQIWAPKNFFKIEKANDGVIFFGLGLGLKLCRSWSRKNFVVSVLVSDESISTTALLKKKLD